MLNVDEFTLELCEVKIDKEMSEKIQKSFPLFRILSVKLEVAC